MPILPPMTPFHSPLSSVVRIMLIALFLISVGLVSAQMPGLTPSPGQMPQDYWVDQGNSVSLSRTEAEKLGTPTADGVGHIYWPYLSLADSHQTGLGTNGEMITGFGGVFAYTQISLMDQSLQDLGKFGNFWNIQGMTCDAKNNLYVLDCDGRVYVYDADQKLLRSFVTDCRNGTRGEGSGSFGWMTNASGAYSVFFDPASQASGYKSHSINWLFL